MEVPDGERAEYEIAHRSNNIEELPVRMKQQSTYGSLLAVYVRL
jgi:hypothetical protein